MADGLVDVWQRALDANVRYYEAWGRVANEYVRELSTALKGFNPGLRLPTITLPTVNATTGGAVRPGAVDSTQQPPPRPTVVLEAMPGATAQGAVLVENHLAHPVSAAIRAHVDGDIDIVVEPDRVELAPGESAVVRVSTTIPHSESSETFEMRGELLVPELVGTVVPLLIRGHPGAPDRPATGSG